MSEKEKTGLSSTIKDNFYGKQSHKETNKAINGLTKEESEVFRQINALTKTNLSFHLINTLIHEAQHAINKDGNEVPSYKAEIKSYKQNRGKKE